MRDIHVGDTLTLYTTFFEGADGDPDRQPRDPELVRLVIAKPSGVVTEYTSFTHVAESGYYEKVISVDEAGWWTGEWRGEAWILATAPFSFRVERDRLAVAS